MTSDALIAINSDARNTSNNITGNVPPPTHGDQIKFHIGCSLASVDNYPWKFQNVTKKYIED
jgi:hypothetical protein